LPVLSAHPSPRPRTSPTELAALWTRLGECRQRARDLKGALAALEKALESDPTRRPLREALLDRYGDDPAHDPAARAHPLRLLAEEPFHAPSLRALAIIEARRGAPDGGGRFLELLAIAGQLSSDERARLGAELADDALEGALSEDDHVRLAHPDALAL